MEILMKPSERTKTQKLISKIEIGTFDENDIDSLFMKLREYSSGFLVFREIADFVAHNHLRDRGLSNQSLETMYLRFKFFLEYDSQKKPLDLSAPFPLWIKRLMMFQVETCDEAVLKERFNVTVQCLKNRIDKGFKDDKKSNTTVYKNGTLSIDTLNAIKYIMSFISAKVAFTQEDLINELVGVLQKNKINFNESYLRLISDKVTICTLLLVHKSNFDIKGYRLAHSEIACEESYILHNVKFVDVHGKEVEHNQAFGNLSIRGCVTLESNELTICHTIMSTTLDTELWCSESLFKIEPLSEEMSNHMCKRIKLDVDLTLDNQFKLTASTTEYSSCIPTVEG